MEPTHSLLKRQLRRYHDPAAAPERRWDDFLAAVDRAYREFEGDRAMLERSLELSSQELVDANAELRAIFDAFPDLCLRLDAAGVVIDHKGSRDLAGPCSTKDLLGKCIHDTSIVPRDQALREAIDAARRTRTVVSLEYTTGGSSHPRCYEARLVPLAHDHLLLIVRNVTDRRQTEESLKQSEERYRDLVENAHDLIQSVGTDGRLLFANRAWAETLGYRQEEIASLTVFDVIHPASMAHCRELLSQLAAGRSPLAVKTVFRTKDGRSVVLEGTVAGRYTDGRLTSTLAILHDITEQREWEERLEHATHHDHLTSLPNRTVFIDRLRRALARFGHRSAERPLGVLVLDLDLFKRINAMLGHAAGDQLLMGIAQRLITCLRDGDTVARVGGDEFAILLPEIAKPADAAAVAEKIFAALAPPVVVAGQELFVTASIGVSVAPDDGTDAWTLLKQADAAMYRAKDHGRNTYQVHAAGMSVQGPEQLSLERSLRYALDRDEFVVFYQPQVDTHTNRITGMEALVRWQHPQLGLVSPAQFIPLAEETGLIVPIGDVVLRKACAQNRSWQAEGIAPFPVAVNVSARQFRQADFQAAIAQAVRASGLDPRWLELELTESLLLDNASETVTTITNLRRMGIRFAIDDFGLGYSSLSYLKRFPLDTVKIDHSFVRHVTTNPDDAAIVRAIIAIARSLKLGVIAEGVETEDQAAFLRQEACATMQGYLVSRPIPADEMTALLRADRWNVPERKAA